MKNASLKVKTGELLTIILCTLLQALQNNKWL